MPKTILIVEDYTDVREIMKIIVRTYGYEVLIAADGHEAVKLATEHKPDLILMDLAMPLMDGLKATELIRETNGLEKVPIVAITAYHDAFFKLAIEAGVTQVIGKPLDFEKLESLLTMYLA